MFDSIQSGTLFVSINEIGILILLSPENRKQPLVDYKEKEEG